MPARVTAFLAEHWLILLLALGAVLSAIRTFFSFRSTGSLRTGWIFTAGILALLAVGHFLPGALHSRSVSATQISLWTVYAALGGLFLAVIGLLATGYWWAPLAVVMAAALSLGLGGLLVTPIQAGIAEVFRSLPTLQFVQPGWLLCLLAVPLVLWISRRSLAGLGPVRRWLAIETRCGLVALLALALAEPRLRRPNDNVTVLFVVDRSLSVPQEIDPGTAESPGGAVDRRWQRVQQFINEAVAHRGHDHRNDSTGAIFFARRPKLIMPPGVVDKLFVSDALAGPMDANYTDIAGALKLAMASFPEGTGKRIVLISDGNENLGNAEAQADLARQNGIHIDTVPLAVGYRNENEVLIQSVEAPPRTAQGARVGISVMVRNAHPSRFVFGKLELLQSRDGRERPVPIQEALDVLDARQSPALVRLKPGLNSFSFRDKGEGGGKEDEFSFTYRAVFQPIESRDPDGKNRVEGLPGDRIQNNRAAAHVIARGQRRVLFVEQEGDGSPHQHLIDQLRSAKFTVVPITPARLPQNADDLAVFLSNYDCVVLANVPSELLTKEQQEVIRSNTHDQGCGLVMIGGPDSFGAGGYHKTPVEEALPVECEIKAIKAAGRGGLVLIMHASEMADGNTWQKVIAKLAIQRLSPVDMVGVMQYGLTTTWHIPLQQVGGDKGRLMAQVDRMTPGDMPDFDPFLTAAFDTLSEPRYGLATKHVIVISDGDPSLGPIGQKALANMRQDGITCTTVGVATHGMPENNRLQEIADGAYNGPDKAGKFYNVTDPSRLPAIYIKESRRVSQSYLYTERFNPKLLLRGGPTDKLESPLPDLHGFVRTTLKPSPLAEMLIEGPAMFDQRFAILASWQYGLGRTAAFTSDARTIPEKVEGWDRHWAGSEMYLKFWEQVVGWALRGLETDRLSITTKYREGIVTVTVQARDENKRAITDLKLEGAVTIPAGGPDAGRSIDLAFEQRSGGVYEAQFKGEDVGTYLVNVRAKQSVPLFPDGKPRYKGRFKDGLPMNVSDDGSGKLRLADGTEVKRLQDGTLLYADDGKPVEIQERADKVVDSRRAGVTISYSPEFADLESNTALLRTLSRITGGNVYSEEPAELKRLAESGELFRPAPSGFRSLHALWYWLVFVAGLLLLFDVAVRRIAVEPAEVRHYSARLWARLRNRGDAAAAEEDAFLGRLKQRKAQADENIERGKGARRFETTGAPPAASAPAGADAAEPPRAPTKPPTAPPTTAKPQVEEDYFSKLRRAKKRAPHEQKGDEDTDEPRPGD
jgi:uncharacterized membrane protein